MRDPDDGRNRSRCWQAIVFDRGMSKRNNGQPGQYKVAGREKPGKPLGPEKEHSVSRGR
jgi:hypothetical protein